MTLRFLPVAALLLAGCQDAGDARICGSLAAQFPIGQNPETADDQLQVTASCVERWAARLSASDDPADTVARAAVAACEDAVSHLVAMRAKEGSAADLGQETGYWKRRALFIAVQTRAGNCYPDA